MSTFDGIVSEFPLIRIDHFRTQLGKVPPTAYFLSHVHSDHLLGLETCRAGPFVYCSAATRRLLLKMEKYSHRINFSKGLLEARKQTYRHLKTILRPLPLCSPVDVELSPKLTVRVTLFDANHCPGAVMFLIEGDGKAILYTGDIRSEPWWVNAIARQPALLPYCCGLKQIDCIYLDTTFASRSDIHREFPTKSAGLAELAKKIMDLPADSVYYFRAWTLGYEDVWILLSRILNSKVHVDRYQYSLFKSISEDGLAADVGPTLTGFQVGNGVQQGCLTTNGDEVKLHSCEPGSTCHDRVKRSKKTVWITPIISRLEDGTEVAEIGAGGGKGDLYQQRDVEIDDQAIVETLLLICAKLITDPMELENITKVIKNASEQDGKLQLNELTANIDTELSIREFLASLLREREKDERSTNTNREETAQIIRFPYSRHSSYSELRHLVETFRPRDVCPCTVDLDTWQAQDMSMASLFGDICSGKSFKYDRVVQEEIERRKTMEDQSASETQPQMTQETETQESGNSQHSFVPQDVEQAAMTSKSPAVDIDAQASGKLERITDARSRKEILRDAWRAANHGSDHYFPADDEAEWLEAFTARTAEESSEEDMFENTPTRTEEQVTTRRRSTDVTTTHVGAEAELTIEELSHVNTRRAAFAAAVTCLETGNDSSWSSIKLQCIGRGYHSEKEIEL